MSQQLLGGPVRQPSAVVRAVPVLALAVAPPGPQTVATVGAAAGTWALRDGESLRGAALVAESQIAGEDLARLGDEHARLLTGGSRAPQAAPSARSSLRRLLDEVTAAGVVLPDGARPDLAGALWLLAALDDVLDGAAAPVPAAALLRWREELLTEHLLAWGVVCLSRVQLGAQTYFYQGVAALGLGLLRHAATSR